MRKKIKSHPYSNSNKKAYSSQSFRSKKESRNFKTKFILILSLLAVFIIFIIYFLFFSKFFNIKEVKINEISYNYLATENAINDQVNSNNRIFSQKNIINFNKNKAEEALKEFNFASISIKKSIFSRILTIEIREREEAFVYVEGDTCFIADINSIIIKKCPEDKDEYIFLDENIYPLIKNSTSNSSFNEKTGIIRLDPEYINFAINLHNDLKDSTELGLRNIALDEEYNTIKILLNNGLEVYFSLKDNYEEQLSRFLTLKREKSSDLRNRRYIDLRYGERIFYY